MTIKLISEKFGLVSLEQDPLTSRHVPGNRYYSSSNNEFGHVKVQIKSSTLLHAMLIHVGAIEDDFLQLVTVPDHNCIVVFVFLNSLFINTSGGRRKLFHDRSCNLVIGVQGALGLDLRKGQNYLVMLICLTQHFIEQTNELASNSRIRHISSPSFYHPRSVIVTRETMNLLSILFFDEPGIQGDSFTAEEVSHKLLEQITEPNPLRIFQPANLSIEDAQLFYQVKNNLLRHTYRNLPYQTLLNQAGISDTTGFRRRLKQLYGLNVRDFITEARLAAAVSLLKQGELSIKETAFKTGFVNAAYFSRIFTRYFGLSPKQLQQHFLK